MDARAVSINKMGTTHNTNPIDELSAWLLARVNRGEQLSNIDLAGMPEVFRGVACAIVSGRNGKDAPTLLKKELKQRFPSEHAAILARVMNIDPKRPAPSLMPFRVLSADAILSTNYPEPIYTIPELLSVGLGTLGGRPKVGKSWLALQTAQAIAAGGYVLGKKVDAAPVLYLALEDSPRRIKERMTSQGWKKGLPVDFLHVGDMNQIGMLHEGGAEKLQEGMRIKGYKLVVIDTLSRAMRGLDPKKTHLVARALELLHELAHEQNATILTIDHMRKPGASGEDIVSDLIDSTVKTAIVDTIWGLYRERGKLGANLQITGKDVSERTLSLEFDHATLCWQSKGDASRIRTPREQQYLEIVRKFGKIRANQIAGELNRNLSNVAKELKGLVNDGILDVDPLTREYSLKLAT